MVKKLRLKPLISAKVLLLSLSIMVLLHVTVMVFYTQYSRHTQHELNQDKVIEQMINIIELVTSTPVSKRNDILKNLYVPYITTSISAKNKWTAITPNGSLWRIKSKLNPSFGHLQLSYKLNDGTWLNLDATVESYGLELQLGLIILEIVVAGALLFSAWSVNRFTEPLKQFKTAADQLGVESTTNVTLESGPSIVRETANAMNKMQARIQQLLENRTKMLAAISHDLRTPITRLKLRAQFIQDETQYEKAIRDLDEMETMISQILAYAKSEYNAELQNKMDLNSLLQSITDEYQDLNHNVQYKGVNNNVIIFGKRLALKRAINNFINNAIRHASRTDVCLQLVTDAIIVTIDDNGPGISDEDMESILEPFYRADRARSSDTGGVGLGLSVAHDILLHHQAKLQLANRPEGGLRVVITFPAAN